MFIQSHVAVSLLASFLLLACGCVSPKPEDCIGQGPDWVVATYGKEKAAEINAIGYEKWIDESVGYNLTNGYFKLVVDIAPAVTNTTRIKVGKMTVVADRPGKYPFLCYKGDRYVLAFDPPSTNIDLLATDDMAIPPCNAAKNQTAQTRKRLGGRNCDGLANKTAPHPDAAASSHRQLSEYHAYPTMDRAMELFDANTVLATNVSMRSETYGKFAEDLRCQTTSENARNMETFLLNAVTSIVVAVSTNAVDDGTSAYLLYDRGEWFSGAAKTFHDLPTNPANCIAVATYLGGVHGVEFPTNLLRRGSCSFTFFSLDPAKQSRVAEWNANAAKWRATFDLQYRVRTVNEAVDQYRKDLLSVCNVGVRGCRAIMDDTQYCVFTNQLATASHASEEELQILFRPQGEGD